MEEEIRSENNKSGKNTRFYTDDIRLLVRIHF